MKRPFIMAAACLTLAILAPALQAQTWSTLKGRGYWYFKMDFLDSRRIFAVGLPGILLRSADGGDTWNESAVPMSNSGLSLRMTHPDTGWLWNNDTLYRTVDGAETWAYRNPPARAFNCSFLNGTQGFLAPFNGGLYATLDGGATWIQRRDAERKGLASLNFLDPARGFAIEVDSSQGWPPKTTALRSTDSGKTWSGFVLPPDIQDSLSGYLGLLFTSPLQGIVKVRKTVGPDLEFSTLDGGESWSRREIPRQDSIVVHGYIGESFQYGFDYRGSSKAMVSRDDGATWNRLAGSFPSDVNAMQWRHPDTGWAIGAGFIFKTTDGGKTWAQQIATLGSGVFVDDILFQDPAAGWAIVGRNIYRTANGGRTWSLQAKSDTTNWSSLHPADFTGTRTLIGLGFRRPYPPASGRNAPVIGVSKDGGATWGETALDTLMELGGFAFGSDQTGYVLANHTARDSLGLFKTTDKGDTWTFLRLPYRAYGAGIQFLDGNDGFVAASGLDVNSMLIVRIEQGGAASSVIAQFPKLEFAGMNWETLQRGWVVSRDTVHRTLDGGATWSKTSLGTWKGSHRVVALDARNAAIIARISSDSGRILKTTDGFATWSVERLPMEISDLQFLPSGDGYAWGGQGQIMKYSALPARLSPGIRTQRTARKPGLRFEGGIMRFRPADAINPGILETDASGRRLGARPTPKSGVERDPAGGGTGKD